MAPLKQVHQRRRSNWRAPGAERSAPGGIPLAAGERASLFAQELRTPMPVSVKRLTKSWESPSRPLAGKLRPHEGVPAPPAQIRHSRVSPPAVRRQLAGAEQTDRKRRRWRPRPRSGLAELATVVSLRPPIWRAAPPARASALVPTDLRAETSAKPLSRNNPDNAPPRRCRARTFRHHARFLPHR